MTNGRTPRCQKCWGTHRKCAFSHQPETCNYCLKTGNECRPYIKGKKLRPLPGRPQPLRHCWSVNKCDRCRRGHSRCEPVNRVWPEKCHRCLVSGYPCSPGRTGQEQLDHDQGIVSQPQPSSAGAMPLSHVASSFELESDSVSVSDSNGFIPAVLPARANPEPSQEVTNPELALQLRKTIHNMEAEFAEVLMSEHARFDRTVGELKARHEQELNSQRKKYEERIDDLIQIMKKIG